MSRHHPVSQIQHSLSAFNLPEMEPHQCEAVIGQFLLFLILRTSRFPQVWVLQVFLLLKVVSSYDHCALLLAASDDHQADAVQGVTWGCYHPHGTIWVQV